MTQRLTPTAAALLIMPPLLWAGNAVVGRVVSPLVSPMTLNLLRWTLAFLFCCPWQAACCAAAAHCGHSGAAFTFLALFSTSGYNALLYLALNTSTPINATLVGASMPVWMLLIGRFFFGQPFRPARSGCRVVDRRRGAGSVPGPVGDCC
jgi:drug/metabolite transporter (DMT)-like permease